MFEPSAPDWKIDARTAEEDDVLRNITQLVKDLANTRAAFERMKAEVQAVLERMEAEVHTLDQRLFSLRALRAPISRLPDDLLSDIFQITSESRTRFDWKYNSTEYTCRRVCRRWNEVGKSRSSVWTQFWIGHPNMVEHVGNQLRRYPDTAPLTISMNYMDHSTGPKPCEDFLTRNQTRFKALRLRVKCSTCLGRFFLESDDAALPQLQALDIEDGISCDLPGSLAPHPISRSIDLRKITALRSLSFSSGLPHRPHPPSMSPIIFAPTRTVLELKLCFMRLFPEQLSSLLQGCPNLRQLSVSEVQFQPEEEPSQLLPKVELPHLRRLRADFERSPENVDQCFARLALGTVRDVDIWYSDESRTCMTPSLVSLLPYFTGAEHVRLLLHKPRSTGPFTALWENDEAFPALRHLHVGNYPVSSWRWQYKYRWYGDIGDIVKPILKRRWGLMQELSPSACLVLPTTFPVELVTYLRAEGVRVETVEIDPEAWPGSW